MINLDTMKVLRQPFDIAVHKATFTNYLEIIILENGSITYAVPSHQEALIRIACERNGMTRQELEDACPIEYYADYMTWLARMAAAVAVWNDFYIGEPNDQQQLTLDELRVQGLFKD